MSEQTQSIDLKIIINKIFRSWKLILTICLLALAGAALMHYISGNKYKHKTVVLLRNPNEADRNQTFAQPEHYYQNIRSFADEDHIDEVMAITSTTDFYWSVVSECQLQDVYGEKAESYLRKNLTVKRSSNRDIEFSFISQDKELGPKVVNHARDYVEKKYAEYFKTINQKRIDQLRYQARELSSQIAQLSDSITALRSAYQIPSQLLPVRGENAVQTQQGVDGHKAQGLEILQVYTTRKDRLVEDLAMNQSLINQFSISLQDEYRPSFFHIIQDGGPDKYEQVPNVIYLFLSVFLSSLLLGVLISLLRK